LAGAKVFSKKYFDQLGNKFTQIGMQAMNVPRPGAFGQVALSPVEI
jgi:hypothetical protein